MAKDYYGLLGVRRDADEKEIRTAYRRLARRYHPDVNPNDKAAEAKFKEIQEAYDVLEDPAKRRLYDQYGEHWEAAHRFGGVPPSGYTDFGDFGEGPADFESIFQQIFGGFGGMGRGRRVRVDFGDPQAAQRRQEEMRLAQPRDVEKSVEIPLEEIDKGTKRRLTYQTLDAVQSPDGSIRTVPKNREVMVSIPAGIPDGKKLRVAGMGATGLRGRSGDLYVTVRWARHATFKPVGEHLEVEVEVPFTIAALGGEIKVPTLRSPLKVKVPPGTQSGQTFRLAGQGISRMSASRGDLLARAKITVPKSLTEGQKKLLEQLRELEAAK